MTKPLKARSWQFWKRASTAPTSMALYSSKDWNFQVAYPSTWEIVAENRQEEGGWNMVVTVGDTSGKNGTVAMMVRAADGAVLAKVAGFSVVSIPPPGQERKLAQSPAEFLRKIQDDDAAFSPGYERIASGELTIGRSPAVRRLYSYDGPPSRRQEMGIMIFCAMSTYELLFEAPATDWAHHEPTFQKIVESFRWLRTLDFRASP